MNDVIHFAVKRLIMGIAIVLFVSVIVFAIMQGHAGATP